MTSYNAEPSQTDATPCHAGGTGFNICELAKSGKRPIAFSQDLLAWAYPNGKFNAGDEVMLESTDYPNDSRCNGLFLVSDGMNKRFRNRADIFFLDRKDNISCNAKVYIKK